MSLAPQQQYAKDRILALIQTGGAIYLTGEAGTGKSYTINDIRETVRNHVVIASTGLAAINVGGITFHSALGLTPGPVNREDFRFRNGMGDVFRNAQLIIVDEVSMARVDLIEVLDAGLRHLRDADRPFGGAAVVFVGDIWQIEPVVATGDERNWLNAMYGGPFFFQSPAFNAALLEVIELTEIHRQKGDPVFAEALNATRKGGHTHLSVFNQRVAYADQDTLRLCFTNAKAREINDAAMNRVDGTQVTFKGSLSGNFGRELPTEETLVLKIGARVMVVANGGARAPYVNGDLGIVEDITTEDQVDEDGEYVGTSHVAWVRLDRIDELVPIGTFTWSKYGVRWNAEENKIESFVVAEFRQVPLKLAYAITVHKSQGQTYERAHLELERRAFAHGLTYVALSRVKTLGGLSLGRPVFGHDIIVNPLVRDWWAKMEMHRKQIA